MEEKGKKGKGRRQFYVLTFYLLPARRFILRDDFPCGFMGHAARWLSAHFAGKSSLESRHIACPRLRIPPRRCPRRKVAKSRRNARRVLDEPIEDISMRPRSIDAEGPRIRGARFLKDKIVWGSVSEFVSWIFILALVFSKRIFYRTWRCCGLKKWGCLLEMKDELLIRWMDYFDYTIMLLYYGLEIY